jgi:hypothetical protein
LQVFVATIISDTIYLGVVCTAAAGQDHQQAARPGEVVSNCQEVPRQLLMDVSALQDRSAFLADTVAAGVVKQPIHTSTFDLQLISEGLECWQ